MYLAVFLEKWFTIRSAKYIYKTIKKRFYNKNVNPCAPHLYRGQDTRSSHPIMTAKVKDVALYILKVQLLTDLYLLFYELSCS